MVINLSQRDKKRHLDAIKVSQFLMWCLLSDLNQQPTAYKAVALPIELRRRLGRVGATGLEPATSSV